MFCMGGRTTSHTADEPAGYYDILSGSASPPIGSGSLAESTGPHLAAEAAKTSGTTLPSLGKLTMRFAIPDQIYSEFK
jgi:hypothetical protein